MSKYEQLAARWLRQAERLREEAGTSAATQNKLRRARADQLEDDAKQLYELVEGDA